MKCHRFKRKGELLCLFALLALLAFLIHQDEPYEDPWAVMEEWDTTTPGPFPYLINEENKCAEGSPTPFLVLLIATEARVVNARNVIRQTWGSESVAPGLRIVRLFLLAKTQEDKGEQAMLEDESQKYHDIIQQDFLDKYNNLTLKTLMGVNWVAMYCPQAHYVMKTDSDVFVNIELLVKEVLRPDLEPKTTYYTGFVNNGLLPLRDPFSKWYMPFEIFPDPAYPAYCSGSGYIFSGRLARGVYRVALTTQYIHFEDVFVGICLAQLGVRPTLPPEGLRFMAPKGRFSSSCAYRYLVTSHGFYANDLLKYWQELQDNKYMACKKNTTNPVTTKKILV